MPSPCRSWGQTSAADSGFSRMPIDLPAGGRSTSPHAARPEVNSVRRSDAAEPHLGLSCQAVSEGAENARDLIPPGTGSEHCLKIADTDVCLKCISVGASEPMPSLPEQAVAGLGITLKIPGLHEVVQPKKHWKKSRKDVQHMHWMSEKLRKHFQGG